MIQSLCLSSWTRVMHALRHAMQLMFGACAPCSPHAPSTGSSESTVPPSHCQTRTDIIVCTSSLALNSHLYHAKLLSARPSSCSGVSRLRLKGGEAERGGFYPQELSILQ
ncbi:hypothetical protein JB92DRAFT_3029443 [Gautieria morchelliformis]|nr:hypothetical protein JB92DRAFT_3029443 [Gautieria morchelliformis]